LNARQDFFLKFAYEVPNQIALKAHITRLSCERCTIPR